MNNLVGEKLSIITSKAQTTRHRILGIVNGDNFQLIFSDTPGIIKPSYELQDSMMDFVKSALEDADVLLYMVEIGEKSIKDSEVHDKIQSAKIPTIILLNKIDLSTQEDIKNQINIWSNQYPNTEIYPVSALNNFNTEKVINRIIELIPESPAYFPKDQLTDKPERFFVNEKLREKIFLYYNKEIPYSVEVQTEEFKEEESIIRIRSLILVERESQKGIIIGHNGVALKKLVARHALILRNFLVKKYSLNCMLRLAKIGDLIPIS